MVDFLAEFGGQNVTVLPKGTAAESYAVSLANDFSDQDADDTLAVIDLGQLLKQHRRWRAELPMVKPFYAVKCNDDPLVLKVLAVIGLGFDCASKKEIQQVLDIGVEKERIIFANPSKSLSMLRYSKDRGVDLMTFDSVEELHKIKAVYSDARLVLRIAVSGGDPVFPLSLKYGCGPENAPRILLTAKQLGLRVVGVSFHVGSGCRNCKAFTTAISHCRDVMRTGRSIGHKMTLLDIGGGFPGTDKGRISFGDISNTVQSLLQTTEVIRGALSDSFGGGVEELDIIAEPGRYYATSAMTTVVNVIAKKEVTAKSITGKCEDANKRAFEYYISDGIFGSMESAFWDPAIELQAEAWIPISSSRSTMSTLRQATTCRIWGPTDSCMDVVHRRTKLSEVDVGDWLLSKDEGAYSLVFVSRHYSGFDGPRLHYCIDAEEWENLQDLISGKEETGTKCGKADATINAKQTSRDPQSNRPE